MTEHYRKHQRISLEGLALAGELVLHPDPKPVKAELVDISDEGAGIRLAGPVSEEQKGMLDLLVRNAQTGKRTPVAFSFSNAKFPIVIMNTWGGDCYGFIISESGHQKLASLAEQGRSLFKNLVAGAINKGVKEANYKEYPILAIEFLPPDIRAFVEGQEFMGLFVSAFAAEITENIPSIRGKVSGPQDMKILQGVLLRFLKAQGLDARLVVGGAIHFLLLREPETPIEDLLVPAVKHLFMDDRLIGFEEQARLRDVFVEDLAVHRRGAETKAAGNAKAAGGIAPQGTSAPGVSFKSIPDNHPLAGLIKTRFDNFTRKIFFIAKLAPCTANHYFNKFLPRGHDMIGIAAEDLRLAKTMLPRWVQNELQEISNNKDHRVQGLIEEHFRLAMFEYMMARRTQNITHEEIQDLFEGKIPPQFADISDKFFNSVCALIHDGVQLRFTDYRADIDFDRSKKSAEKENELRISKLPPVELVKEFLWPKIVKLGELSPLQREFAKAWVTDENRLMSIKDMGDVVVVPSDTFAEFAGMVDRSAIQGVKASDFFDRVDLGEMYRRVIKMRDGTEVKDVFGLYVDTLEPKVACESIVDKVVNNPSNCVFYILTKSKSYFSKVFGMQGPQAIDLIDRSMLTVKEEAKNFI